MDPPSRMLNPKLAELMKFVIVPIMSVVSSKLSMAVRSDMIGGI
jgi:hypothetical protein